MISRAVNTSNVAEKAILRWPASSRSSSFCSDVRKLEEAVVSAITIMPPVASTAGRISANPTWSRAFTEGGIQ